MQAQPGNFVASSSPSASASSSRPAASVPQATTLEKAEKPGEASQVQAQPGIFGGGFTEAAIATFRDALLAEAKRVKGKLFYNTIVMAAKRIDVVDGRVTFVFGPRPATLAGQFDQQRASLQEMATAIAGRRMDVIATEERDAAPAAAQAAGAAPSTQDKLKASVMNEPAVQAMLDVFPAEIRDVEEM